ncbi:hypothetical protein [Nostoc sp. 2RC]|uniref:hypothetical protein n=1 Tax=Nostoc sp. 2RC TaxID=2485484 RepID=UPI0016282190|nr:hypothetical protein [Nostoc sp. 2RC]MBC1236587.1 hypothetical protein [Nostoc sp. 2RC]
MVSTVKNFIFMKNFIFFLFEPPDTVEFLNILVFIIRPCFLAGIIAGIVTLIITIKKNFFIVNFRLLIEAIAGYEGLVIFDIEGKNLNEILKLIIGLHQNFPGLFVLSTSTISGVIGGNIAVFLMKKVFRWA